jgi:hypothetical protein
VLAIFISCDDECTTSFTAPHIEMSAFCRKIRCHYKRFSMFCAGSSNWPENRFRKLECTDNFPTHGPVGCKPFLIKAHKVLGKFVFVILPQSARTAYKHVNACIHAAF